MLPEVLKGGQRVMMTADPSDAALVRLDGSGGGQRVDVVFPVMHGTFGEDGTIQGLLELADCRLLGRVFLALPLAWTRTFRSGFCRWQKFRLYRGSPCSAWNGARSEDDSNGDRKEIQVSRVCKTRDAGVVVGMSKVHSRAELGPALDLAAEFAMKILIERCVIAREIEVPCSGTTTEGVRAGRNRAAPRILRLRREISGRRHAAADSGKTETCAGEKNPEVRGGRVSRIGTERHGARGFLPGEKGGKIYLNEVNTIPGFTSISMYPKLWKRAAFPSAN